MKFGKIASVLLGAFVVFTFLFLFYIIQPAPGPHYNLSTFLCSEASGHYVMGRRDIVSTDGRTCPFTLSEINRSNIYFLYGGQDGQTLQDFAPSKKLDTENCPFITERADPTIFLTDQNGNLVICHNELGV